MRKKLRSTFNYFIIVILFVLGVIGIILPIVPGVIFFAIGVVILSFELPYIENMLDKYIDKEKDFGKKFFSYKNKLEKYFK